MRGRVLAVDDDPNVLKVLRLYLGEAGFDVVTAESGGEALALMRDEPVDLVILDVVMPGDDGWAVYRRITAEGDTPVMFLTGRGADHERIRGLALGADDYVVKPFNPREVVMRVLGILRRVGKDGAEDRLDYPGLRVDIASYAVLRDGHEIHFTPREITLLWLLARHPNRVFSREEILDRVWGYDFEGDARTVDTHIKRIRAKLGDGPGGAWSIETVWGVGYRFALSR